MRKRNTKLLWGAVIASPLIVLLLIIVLVPILINLQTFKGKVEQDLSHRIGGTITGGRIEIALLPTPHVLFRDVSFSVGDAAAGTLESFSVYPDCFP
ncbi:MAG: hypothetical protein RBS57_00690 [Desulforhabdus sp.]|jgi:hypothetical protein|nr:hypothetical protein [Desulforhabdus sp.]